MEGKVKWFGKDKGYGFIRVPGGEDYFFHVSQVQGVGSISEGDIVSFSPSVGRNDKLAAASVVVKSRKPKQSGRPYYGKATYRKEVVKPAKDGTSKVGNAWGMGIIGAFAGGSAGGPIGVVAGAVIGAIYGHMDGEDKDGEAGVTKKIEITSPCIKCGGEGQVTAQVDGRTGFQCRACGS